MQLSIYILKLHLFITFLIFLGFNETIVIEWNYMYFKDLYQRYTN